MPTYTTPERFKTAVEARIRTAATKAGQDIGRVRQVIIYSRFLARVFQGLGESAIAKGGVVMELRIQHARATRDIDLRLSGSPDETLSKLDSVGRLDLGDWMTFTVGPDREQPTINAEGMQYEGRRFRAECHVAGKLYGMPFGVDVAFGDVMRSLHRPNSSTAVTFSPLPVLSGHGSASISVLFTSPRSSTRTRCRGSGRTHA